MSTMTRRSNAVRESLGDRILQWCIITIVTLFCLAILLPCINILALSFNDGKDAASGGIWFFPREFTLENYAAVFSDGDILTAYGITVARTILGTLLSLLVTSLAAFALHHSELPGNKIITLLITFTMLFGGGLIPTYIQYRDLGLLNSFWIYIFPPLVSVVHLLMMRTFMSGVPESLMESAEIDGCGKFRIYASIMMPLCKPVIAVIGLYAAVGHWNDWFTGAFYMNDTDLWPVQTVLQQMLTQAMSAQQDISNASQAIAQAQSAVTSDSLKMAAVIITMVPILCVYPFIQKYFAQGAMIGAVKG